MRSATVGLGRSLVYAALCVIALIALGFAADIAAPGYLTPLTVSLGASGLALVVAIAAHAKGGRRRTADERVSEELDGLAQRLQRIEARVAALDGRDSRATTTITDMAGDVGTLSAVVRDLAEALSSQERDIAVLASRWDRSATFRAWAAPTQPGHQIGDEPGALVPSFFLAPDRQIAAPKPADEAPTTIKRPDHGAIGSALDKGQLDLHVQPIVSLPQRRTRIYEVYALLRISESHVLVPEEFLPSLDELGRLPELDEQVLARALAFARRVVASGKDATISCALSAGSAGSDDRLRVLRRIIDAEPSLSRRILLELSQAAWRNEAAGGARLAGLREAGVSFGLGRVVDRDLDPGALAAGGVRIVKLPAADIVGADDADVRSRSTKLALSLARHDIQLVAERVVSDDIVPELIEIGVPLAQGFAFAFPSPVETVLGGDRPAALALPALPRAEERVPLRSFLRRGG